MPKTVKKYIESHWMVFVAKGIVALFAGFCLTFSQLNPSTLSATLGFTLVALLECSHFCNTYRIRYRPGNDTNQSLAT